MNKKDQNLCPCGAYVLGGETNSQMRLKSQIKIIGGEDIHVISKYHPTDNINYKE